MPLTNLKDVQIPGYGTISGEPPKVDKFGWLKRGHVTGLLQHVGAQYGPVIALSFYMCLAPFFGAVRIDKQFPCEVGSKYIKTQFGAAICEYTKTYVWSFPQLGFASLLLLAGRDILQMRFYYFMLKHGGVVSFMQFPLLRDSIVIANIWAFAHFWLFVGLVILRLFTSGIDPQIAMEQAAKAAVAAAGNINARRGLVGLDHDQLANSGDPQGLQLLIQLLVLLGIPGVLFMMKLLSAYYLERTLVPLSEYIRDSTTGVEQAKGFHAAAFESDEDDASPEVPEGQDEPPTPRVERGSSAWTPVGGLVSLKDNCLKPLLDTHLESILHEHKDKKSCYKEITKVYVNQGWYKLSNEPHAIELCDSLWLAPFMCAPGTPMSKFGWSFSNVWNLYRRIGLLICGFLLFIQVCSMVIDVHRTLNEHARCSLNLVGEIFNAYFIGLIWQSLYVAHAPDPEKSLETPPKDEPTEEAAMA